MIKIGCYGMNGHQILHELKANPLASLVAVAEIPAQTLVEALGDVEAAKVKICRSYEELLDSGVDFISLCSPLRRKQPEDAVKALERGIHVLAEKPCAFSASELDAILDAALKGVVHFREMGGSELHPPLPEIKRLIEKGALGEIVQAWGQKSYPYHHGRPQDPAIDGGIFQAGLHALRFICALCTARVKDVSAIKTYKGNPVNSGGLAMAACVNLRLDSGALASITVNYLNPKGLGVWGNDQLRIFGTRAMVETVDGFTKGRIVDANSSVVLESAGKSPAKSYLRSYLEFIKDRTPMETDFEIEKGFILDTIKVMDALKA